MLFLLLSLSSKIIGDKNVSGESKSHLGVPSVTVVFLVIYFHSYFD